MENQEKQQENTDIPVSNTSEEKTSTNKDGKANEELVADKIKNSYVSHSSEDKMYLAGALLALIASFLPWISITYYGYSQSVNGWHGFGLLPIAVAVAILALWLLPLFKVDIPKIFPNRLIEKKVLSSALAAGPALYLISGFSSLSYLGFGFWLTVIAAALVLYSAWKK